MSTNASGRHYHLDPPVSILILVRTDSDFTIKSSIIRYIERPNRRRESGSDNVAITEKIRSAISLIGRHDVVASPTRPPLYWNMGGEFFVKYPLKKFRDGVNFYKIHAPITYLYNSSPITPPSSVLFALVL